MKPIQSLIAFIEENRKGDKWYSLLTNAPYNLKIRFSEYNKIDRLVLFSYNMIETDFSKSLCYAARGTILDISKNISQPVKIICHAFDKFFNYGESHAANINWNTATIRAKIDGSLIKVFFNPYTEKWTFATNNGFDVNAELPGFAIVTHEKDNPGKSFKDLVDYALKKVHWRDHLNLLKQITTPFTFYFELVSPYNRIVIPYEHTELYLLGGRSYTSPDNEQEYGPEFLNKKFFGDEFKVPQKMKAKDIQEVVDKAAKLDMHHEGFVVVDSNFNRIKVKGEAYLSMHRLKGEKQFSWQHLFECVKNNTTDDVKAYFPEYIPYCFKLEKAFKDYKKYLKKSLNECIQKYNELAKTLTYNVETNLNSSNALRKEYALYVKENYMNVSSLAFDLLKEINKPEIDLDIMIDNHISKLNWVDFVYKTNFDIKDV
jgi:hypothetical protein